MINLKIFIYRLNMKINIKFISEYNLKFYNIICHSLTMINK